MSHHEEFILDGKELLPGDAVVLSGRQDTDFWQIHSIRDSISHQYGVERLPNPIVTIAFTNGIRGQWLSTPYKGKLLYGRYNLKELHGMDIQGVIRSSDIKALPNGDMHPNSKVTPIAREKGTD